MKESILSACRGCVLHMKQGSFIVKEREQHMASMASMVDSFEFPRFTPLDPWNQIYIHILILFLFYICLLFHLQSPPGQLPSSPTQPGKALALLVLLTFCSTCGSPTHFCVIVHTFRFNTLLNPLFDCSVGQLLGSKLRVKFGPDFLDFVSNLRLRANQLGIST